MPKQTVPEVLRHSNFLFEAQAGMVSLWQILADNFYPERADFTTVRNVGQELADDLIDSYPILARRDMGNSLAAMLRDGEWFKMATRKEPDYQGKAWLEQATERLKELMDDPSAGFTRATKEGDHDYVTFGQAVIEITMNKLRNGLLFRCWHLRDCAWFEDETGRVCGFHRKWRPTVAQLVAQFGLDKLHSCYKTKLADNPHQIVNCRHIVQPAEMYWVDEPGSAKGKKYASLIIDVDQQCIIEETPTNRLGYVVPRFQTVAGSQYAYSPATVCALPDARLIQAMTHTLLEAGERYVRPPLVGTATVIRSDVDLSPDGVTWVDKEYDERYGAALRPLETQRGGYPIGLELREDIKETISSAFYLNKLSLPPVDGKVMTAYEVQERMKQFRRENLPLFAPIEADYNGQLCEIAFELAFSMGLLGSPYDVPQSLQGVPYQFKFKSPLSAAEEETKAVRFAQMRDILAAAMQIDPAADEHVDIDVAMRDAIEGISAPTRWLRPLELAQKRQLARTQADAAVAAAAAPPMQPGQLQPAPA